MESITVKGFQREILGKSKTRTLRKAGKVPCIIYGGDRVLHFSVDEEQLKHLIYTPNVYTVDLELEGEKFKSILKDAQFHPVTDKILHIDFYQLNEGKEISMEIPIKIVGRSKGVVSGGLLRKNLSKLKVRAIPSNLPDCIEVDVTPLDIGNKLYASDLKNDKYKILHSENTIIVHVRTSRAVTKSVSAEKAKTK